MLPENCVKSDFSTMLSYKNNPGSMEHLNLKFQVVF